MNNPLKRFANSGMWELIKEEIFIPELDEIRDVRTRLNNVSAKDAYEAKILASESLQKIIDRIDRLRENKPIVNVNVIE